MNIADYDVCIIGAGFSGLVLAIKLAGAGLKVCLIELNRIVGRRILSTGNGRCNFTNNNLGKEYYFSNSNLDFICDNHDEFLEFLMEIGVFYKDLDGYYYPITNQSKTVRDALENEINRLKVDVYLDNRAKDISYKNGLFTVTTTRINLTSKKVSVSSGGLAAATLGSSKFGYKVAAGFGMKVTKLAPALVGLSSSDLSLKQLSGVRSTGVVAYKDHYCAGEIQFNKDGISGYPIMCISRFVGLDELDKKISDIRIDFIPYLDDIKLKCEIKRRFLRNPDQDILSVLVGLSNEKVTEQIVSLSRIYKDTPAFKLDDEDIKNLVYNFKNFTLSISGTRGFDNAQVTAGGISLDGIDINTMESQNRPGLFFTGEVLDIDGICGGYNITWAYTSACVAANAIIRALK